MKIWIRLFVAASLVGNAALGVAYFHGKTRLADEAVARAAVAHAAVAAKRSAGSVVSGAFDSKLWASLNQGDLPALVARLREAGFPRDMVRAVVSGVLDERFAARRRALDPGAEGRPFWKDGAISRDAQAASFRLAQEQERALRDALGRDALPADPLTLARLRSRFGDLPADQLDAVRLIDQEFSRRRSENYYATGVYDAEANRRFDREQRAAITAVVSSAQLEEYDLRYSRTGQTLRNELRAFEPTEAEFRAIFRLRQPFDEQFNYSTGFTSQEELARRDEAQRQMLAQLAAQLGPDRAAEYARATDSNYRRTSQLVARLELPAETTRKLWDVQQDFQKRSRDFYSPGGGAALSPVERTAALTALQQQAVAAVLPLLGNASRVEAYKQLGGSWIDYLVPRPAPPSATPPPK
ncbi:MAG: hypothetical protein RLZZ15_27 [Verrucomicrobiota bacterium]|jgi:hypothetical protein